MTYNPAIPGPNDLISQSQAQIQTNFSQADTAFAVDHTAFSVTPNQGQHKKVTLIAPIANPNLAGNLASVYTKTSGAGVELFYQHGIANLGVSQLTGGGITTAAYCIFNGTTVGTNPPNLGFNVTSITRLGVGQYRINFTRNFSSVNYISQIMPSINGSGTSILLQFRNVADLTFQVLVGGVATDSNDISAVFFGVLA